MHTVVTLGLLWYQRLMAYHICQATAWPRLPHWQTMHKDKVTTTVLSSWKFSCPWWQQLTPSQTFSG